jgi:hypothetical protein
VAAIASQSVALPEPPVSVTVIVLPTVTDVDEAFNTGAAAIANGAAADGPFAGENTVTCAVPALATSAAGMAA